MRARMQTGRAARVRGMKVVDSQEGKQIGEIRT
jgi:hypothetical protein